MIVVSPMAAGQAVALEELQRLIFPTLSAGERLRAEHYRRHLELFPEGQWVLLDGEGVVGATTTMRTTEGEGMSRHTFSEMSGGGWMGRHRKNGEWLYGLDMGVAPEYRGRGYSRLLYRARQELVRRLGLRGQLTVGMMNGYGRVAEDISGEEYYRRWCDGLLVDPTLTPQRKIGFRPVALIPGYLDDPACGGFGVLLRMDARREV